MNEPISPTFINKKKILTLCILHQHPRVLLGMKKRGFGKGRWNGFGGKVEPGETIEEGAVREMREEAGILVKDLEKVGIIDFEFEGDPVLLEVHVYRTESFAGAPEESEEMKPEWFHVDAIPFADMWPDDIYWFPLLLDRKKFKAAFLFGKDDIVLEQKIVEVKTLR